MNEKAKTRKRINLFNLAKVVFVFSAILFLFSSVGLRAVNSYLNVQVQKCQNEIAELQISNEAARLEVNQLGAYDRISAIVSEEGMTTSANVYVVPNE